MPNRKDIEATNKVEDKVENKVEDTEKGKQTLQTEVTMENGSKVTFAGKIKIQTDHSIVNENSVLLKYNIVTGQVISEEVTFNTTGMNEFEKKVIVYGLDAKVRSFISGKTNEEIYPVIMSKIKELQGGLFYMRGNSQTKLSKNEIAYAIAYGIPYESMDDIQKLKDHLDSLSKEERKNTFKSAKVLKQKTLLEIAEAQAKLASYGDEDEEDLVA